MAINYSIAAMKNPNPMAEEEVKYYAKAQANGVVTIDQLAEEIAYSTTLTDGDVLNAIRALVAQIRKHIQNGQIVRLEALGSFRLTFSGAGASSAEEYSPALIRSVNLRFTPGASLKQVLSRNVLKFVRVPLLKDKEEEEAAPEEDSEEEVV